MAVGTMRVREGRTFGWPGPLGRMPEARRQRSIAIALIAFVREETGSMFWLFTGLGIAGVAVVLSILALPTVARERPVSAPAE